MSSLVEVLLDIAMSIRRIEENTTQIRKTLHYMAVNEELDEMEEKDEGRNVETKQTD